MFSLKVGPPSLLVVFIFVLSHLHPSVTSKQKCSSSLFDHAERHFKEFKNEAKDLQTKQKTFARAGDVEQSQENIPDLSIIRQRDLDQVNHEKELAQLPFAAVTSKLIDKHNMTVKHIDTCLSELEYGGKNTDNALQACLSFLYTPPCNLITPYRTIDGTCNNFLHPRWGSAGACFERLLPASYVDGSDFRQSVDGGSLPEPRNLSLHVHEHLDRPAKDVSHMYMFFGQLVDHDVTQAPISRTDNNKTIVCCDRSGPFHPQCAPIFISPDDPFYSEFKKICINFVRSAICPTCSLGPRQQTNEITAFIDASFVYSTNIDKTSELREKNARSGRMEVDKTSVGDLLPKSNPDSDGCSFKGTDNICFKAGDDRVNQHPPLASLQTLFVREHNRLADELRSLKSTSNWSGEKIFQEARRIVGAEMQVITYKEYLPITLGDERMDHFNLKLKEGSGRTSYDSRTNPTLYTEFSAAAFRFGHSLINSLIAQVDGHSMLLRDNFFEPFGLRKGILSDLMVGVTKCPSQEFDRHLVPDVTNYLYRSRLRKQKVGLDLAAINIQRGRDHGLPPYTDMVGFCTPEKIVTDFEDLVSYNLMSDNNAQLLKQYYKFVDDIDLWTGIVSELPLEGAKVGPTGACIIGKTFSNLKFGDRFYFEHKFTAGEFKNGQVQELKKMTLSKLICLNTNGTISSLPTNAFLLHSDTNPPMDCSSVKGVDIELWG